MSRDPGNAQDTSGAPGASGASSALPDGAWPDVGVVIPAGGLGLRAGAPEPKQFLPLRGKPMLDYALETFQSLDFVKAIVLVLPPERLDALSDLTRRFPKVRLARGGAQRWESVRNGFEILDPALPFVLVHDAARPFVGAAIVRRCVAAARSDACVIAALPATDTIKEVDGARVARTLDRTRLIQVQTPQVFPRRILADAYAGVSKKGSPGTTGSRVADQASSAPTDEATLVEAAGCRVVWVTGGERNRKVTGAEDLAWAEWMAGRLAAGELRDE